MSRETGFAQESESSARLTYPASDGTIRVSFSEYLRAWASMATAGPGSDVLGPGSDVLAAGPRPELASSAPVQFQTRAEAAQPYVRQLVRGRFAPPPPQRVDPVKFRKKRMAQMRSMYRTGAAASRNWGDAGSASPGSASPSSLLSPSLSPSLSPTYSPSHLPSHMLFISTSVSDNDEDSCSDSCPESSSGVLPVPSLPMPIHAGVPPEDDERQVFITSLEERRRRLGKPERIMKTGPERTTDSTTGRARRRRLSSPSRS